VIFKSAFRIAAGDLQRRGRHSHLPLTAVDDERTAVMSDSDSETGIVELLGGSPAGSAARSCSARCSASRPRRQLMGSTQGAVRVYVLLPIRALDVLFVCHPRPLAHVTLSATGLLFYRPEIFRELLGRGRRTCC